MIQNPCKHFMGPPIGPGFGLCPACFANARDGNMDWRDHDDALREIGRENARQDDAEADYAANHQGE